MPDYMVPFWQSRTTKMELQTIDNKIQLYFLIFASGKPPIDKRTLTYTVVGEGSTQHVCKDINHVLQNKNIKSLKDILNYFIMFLSARYLRVFVKSSSVIVPSTRSLPTLFITH